MSDSTREMVKAFSIQGRLYRERERLAGCGMTDKERAFRKQWINDQKLASHEPVDVPELYKFKNNIFKRLLRMPLDMLFKPMVGVLGKNGALLARQVVGKCLFGISLAYLGTYYVKYNTNDWTRKGGWRLVPNRPNCLEGDELCCDKVAPYCDQVEQKYTFVIRDSKRNLHKYLVPKNDDGDKPKGMSQTDEDEPSVENLSDKEEDYKFQLHDLYEGDDVIQSDDSEEDENVKEGEYSSSKPWPLSADKDDGNSRRPSAGKPDEPDGSDQEGGYGYLHLEEYDDIIIKLQLFQTPRTLGSFYADREFSESPLYQ